MKERDIMTTSGSQAPSPASKSYGYKGTLSFLMLMIERPVIWVYNSYYVGRDLGDANCGDTFRVERLRHTLSLS